MGLTVALMASTIYYPQGGGHTWVYLNWALGLRALGCRVIWLEAVEPTISEAQAQELLQSLRSRLERYGLADHIALCSSNGDPLPRAVTQDCLDLNAAAEADLLLNLRYGTPAETVHRFQRTALLDIDPGLLQVWLSEGKIAVAAHDAYFTIGETVGQPNARFYDAGLPWNYTPPAVSLDWWSACPVPDDAPFTTVSHWTMGEWMVDGDEVYSNDKRTGFLPFLDLPRHTPQPLELALCLADDEQSEWDSLRQRGWRVRHSYEHTSTPWDYQGYIRSSRGEFSCVKPSCIRLQNAWISDRTLCYLATGRPAVVQHTGPSRFLPDAAGLFRFRNMQEAIRAFEQVNADYALQSKAARALAEEYFDAAKVAKSVLERAMA
jgi:hypothetical protein